MRHARWGIACLAFAAACANQSHLAPDAARPIDATIDGSGMDGASGCSAPMIACQGACLDPRSDDANCGTCGNACPAGVGCVQGACTCHAPSMVCGSLCLDTRTDVMNCGACGHACAATEMCVASTCLAQCSAPHILCMDPVALPDAGPLPDSGPQPDAGPIPDAGPVDASVPTMPVCADPMTDPNNCGACNIRCHGGATCSGGHCMCGPGQSPCGGVCTDLTTVDHCGTCTNVCGTGGRCTSPDGGMLQCTACGTGYSRCGTQCVNTQSDPSNCMTCGHSCAPMEICMAGACRCTGTHGLCGGVCSDLQNDPNNCGSCGSSCGMGGVCVSGVCQCGAPYMRCSGTSCTDTSSDRMNCGTCGHACTPAAPACLGGVCSAAPPTHYLESTPTATVVPYINACTATGHQAILPATDDGSAIVMLPFAFRYWATDLPANSPINVCTNGWMGMDGMMNSSLGGTIPSTGTPNSVIAPHWGDLVTGATGVCVATVGTTPNRQFVVEWQAAHYFASATATLTFEAILSESTGTIDIVWRTMTGAMAETSGLEDPTGAMGIGGCGATTYSCTPAANSRVRFTPTP